MPKKTAKTTRDHAAIVGAKVPADHQKAEATDGEITINWNGFDLTITKDSLDDYEALTALNGGNPTPMVEALIPDADIRAEVLESLRDEETGRLRLTSVIQMVGEILRLVGAGN
ncbi:hypothetical protein NSA19_00960 [Actinomyces bowdenii]|uniref:hypothetical protein n=1 Tax=Actinomyces bowdenii TaxID=131109 RepID=UPI00214BE868|nr:hypothetical protein [Actinomyces bowdenii]MCR2051446.1 hypothetical protein [Actinomyces bowdenii]